MGKVIFPLGKVIFPWGKVVFPWGKLIFPWGKFVFPWGKVVSASAKALIINEKTFFSEVNSQRMALHSPFPAKIPCQTALWGRKRRRGKSSALKSPSTATQHSDKWLTASWKKLKS